MASGLKMSGKSLLALEELSSAQIIGLIDLADLLKKKKKKGVPGKLLLQKNIALIFEKSSTRTRCAATVAAVDEGASVEYLDPRDIHFGKKESVKDTARVLGRMMDGILFRGYSQGTVATLAQYAGIPVWNGLTDETHPTQILADLMTVREYFGTLKKLKVAYVGDGRNNVANSLMVGCAKTGIDFVNCTPKKLTPDALYVRHAVETAKKSGSSIEICHDAMKGVKNANVIYTDVWVSMGEESKAKERMTLLRPYQVNMDLMKATGNLNKGRVIFLHCLPALHDNNTEFTRKLGAMEVTDDVFESCFSKVFDQAENRVHTLKAIMVATLT